MNSVQVCDVILIGIYCDVTHPLMTITYCDVMQTFSSRRYIVTSLIRSSRQGTVTSHAGVLFYGQYEASE